MTENNEKEFPMKAALKCKCPNCGKGRLYKGLLSLGFCDKCDDCAMDYGLFDSGDGPAMIIMVVLGFILMMGVVVLEFNFSPPVWVHVVVWGPTVYVSTLYFLKVGKSLMASAHFTFDAGQGQLLNKNIPESGNNE